MAAVSYEPEMVSEMNSSLVTQCLGVFNEGTSSLVKLCEKIGISLEKMVLAVHSAVYIFTERIKALYIIVYTILPCTGSCMLLLRFGSLPFRISRNGTKEICSRILDISVSHFRNGENSAMCEEAIDGVVTGRTTIVIYCLACVLSCLFVVFYLPLLIEFIKYIWTYNERMKQEEYKENKMKKLKKKKEG